MITPNYIPNMSENDITRFWKGIIITTPNECWNRNKPFKGRGYRTFNLNGVKYQYNRIAWFLYNHKQPGLFEVCHRCDNPQCCNPNHLFIGTSQDNYIDCVTKHRNVNNQGINHGMSTLTESDVLRIRAFYNMGYKQHTIAKQFGIHQATVSKLVNYKRWHHIP